MLAEPTIVALDFDGVLCDGLREYFQTACKAYQRMWPEDVTPLAGLAETFYRLRPVVETGWEMPLVLRSLVTGTPEAAILQNWPAIAQQIVQSEQLDPKVLAAAVDGVRDRWIATDLDSWLAEHRFYPGVIERLQIALNSATRPVIISTKEKRFIEQLLTGSGLTLNNLQIFGKEVKQPKHQTLRELAAVYPEPPAIWFVEDRFKTLQSIQQQANLPFVSLFLADWGYNTAAEKAAAIQNPEIQVIGLAQFAQPFSAWVSA